jgi:polar amino acid transport system substrate-binding protein
VSTDTRQHAMPSDEARADLAPQGKLRLAFPAASALYVTRDPVTGDLRGVSIDLGAALATRLGVAFEVKPYRAVRELVADTSKGEWDIATIVMEDERRKTFDYSRAYLDADSTYLVPAGSAIQKVADADKPGTRIGVAENSAFDLFLTRFVKQAKLIRFGGVGAAFDGLGNNECDLVAAPRQVLVAAQGRFAGSRILNDWFDKAFVGVAVPKGSRAAGLGFVNTFLDEAVRSGFIAEAIARAGMKGAKVASS